MRYFSICLSATLKSGVCVIGDMIWVSSANEYPSMVKMKQGVKNQMHSEENPVMAIAVVGIIEMNAKDFADYTKDMPQIPKPDTGSDLSINFSSN